MVYSGKFHPPCCYFFSPHSLNVSLLLTFISPFVSLYSNLKESSGSLPAEFISHRILPSLISALEFGGASASLILPLVLQFGETCDDYTSVVLAPLVKLYASPDRGTRMSLLDHLPEYAEKLDKKTVSDKIWPHLVRYFF
jgi:SCY1-like protein 1